MTKKKDWDYIARLEKAIADKYGNEAIQNPASSWDKEKEKDDNMDPLLLEEG